MKNNNGFLTIEKQINLLKSKNFILPINVNNILEEVNYYTLMSFKNIFYDNGIEHQYKKNINFEWFYKLYNYDLLIKQEILKNFLKIKNKYISLLSNYFNDYENNFMEQGYLNNTLYKKNIINKIYTNKIINNETVKNYFSSHNFLPIWVLLNSLNYVELINYILDINDEAFSKIGILTTPEELKFSIYVFERIISSEKIYDFRKENLNLNVIINLFEINNVNTEIINIYKDIIKNIPCISQEDIFRETGIKLG